MKKSFGCDDIMSYVEGAIKFGVVHVRKYGYRDPDGYFDESPYSDTWKPQKETSILESQNYNQVVEKAQSISARAGKTFYDEVKINHIDEHGDILHVEFVKDGGEM